MEYLKKYGITELNIEKIKDKYNDSIINFLESNEIFIVNIIEYLYSENIKNIYLLMINNIKIFLENPIVLKEKIEDMKQIGLNRKEIQLKLLQENLLKGSLPKNLDFLCLIKYNIMNNMYLIEK